MENRLTRKTVAHFELARDDRRWDETAAGNGDDGVERAGRSEAPGERARVAVELVP
jgi:hypothetical protein